MKKWERMAAAGGIEAVVEAMKAHLSNPDVQHQGCGALGNIAVNADNNVLVAKAGGIGAVVEAMKAHPSIADVQHRGCGALMSIAGNADNEVLVARAGGIEAVVGAMKAHPSNADVQWDGLGALVNIGWSSTKICQCIVNAGGKDMVMQAQSLHHSHSGVQEKCKELLQKLM